MQTDRFDHNGFRKGLCSALDKLMGLLGIYATWLSSIAYLQNNCVFFYIFYATFLAVITYVFLLNEAIANVPTYLLSLSAFLRIKLADFFVPEAKLIALLTLFARINFAVSFSAKILDWADILFIKLELYCALASKKKSIPDWHLYITRMETKWTKWYATTSHVIAYRSTELLFGMHTFDFNCFFDDF